MNAYTLKKHKETGEMHLFKGRMPADNPKYKCTSNSDSICEGMSNNDKLMNKFSCEDEPSARRKCAEIGRKVCGTCVSHLYETY